MSNLAQIHPDAKIGEGVEIGPFTTIYGDVVIGEGTWIGPNVTIMDGARIGKNCRIFPGAVISAIPQDLKFAGEKTTVEIGDNTTIRECCTLNRGTKDRMTTKVGSNCLLMAYVHLAHDAFVGDNCVIANSANIAGHVTIGNWVVVEGVVAVQQFIEIGDHAFIAGGSLVRKNVPPFIKVAREPLSFIGVNSIGLRRRGYSDEQVSRLEDIYRALFVHNNSLAAGVKQIVETLPESEEKQIVLEFIERSEKGVVRGAQTT
ncbi:MAG: acyl-ACP--UDP-N-acetylglucosamine O-acyltransferase [Flavobacteriales bacterium]|jgi:UDP-N-acetylglucosamine acyltransferase|nr:acyl-ACP--UDP-N-acetylglucosamine O-acyltransferase [Flavobacteriales bacterium]MDP4717329.1 acyl-ACP--UDP-N-acetylglucosamine O-acyltransferase [Flavobacteriales bacterium]MDP4731032.1 acyl-ACP--UDP-N-acetylglucosamine O-acyltransferase [Flavobacteriales bacterium]MDP4818648.1 acyl-ACP--UDP-N-acetylglucosamine O-acyltransferase [Flavobacteriales bacterium]MDP4951867.1 acyl-ACP--UDP-N-acetylglucosamine O-acyltransferase [Flavobacteriales bacterium]